MKREVVEEIPANNAHGNQVHQRVCALPFEEQVTIVWTIAPALAPVDALVGACGWSVSEPWVV